MSETVLITGGKDLATVDIFDGYEITYVLEVTFTGRQRHRSLSDHFCSSCSEAFVSGGQYKHIAYVHSQLDKPVTMVVAISMANPCPMVPSA